MSGGQAWFRLYAEAVDDDKLRMLAFEDRWHFVALLCCKCQGIFDTDDDDDFLFRRLAVKLGLQARELEDVGRRLQAVNLVDARLHPLHWDQRQFKSDHDAAERKRRSREKQRVTTPSRDSHVLEQNRDRTETETLPSGEYAGGREAPPAGLDGPAWDRWLEFRKQIRKPIKPASVPAAQRKLAGFGADQAAVVEQSIAFGWQGLFALKDTEPVRGAPRVETDSYYANLRRELRHAEH